MIEQDIESRILEVLSGERKLTFEELNELLKDIPEEDLEIAVRNLLNSQRIAETGDWNYYSTKVEEEDSDADEV